MENSKGTKEIHSKAFVPRLPIQGLDEITRVIWSCYNLFPASFFP
jgi:hypothetical protein